MSNLELVCNPCHSEIHRQWNIVMPPIKKVISKVCTDCKTVFHIGSNRGRKIKCNTCQSKHLAELHKGYRLKKLNIAI